MPELRQSRGMPSGHHDHLLGLYQEISRSVDTILRSLPGLPLEMRHRALRIARELLLAQSHVIDKLADLSDHAPSFAGEFGRSDPRRPEAARGTHHRPITAWLNQHASDPRAGLADTGSGQAPETNDRPIETFGSSDGHDVASPTSPGALTHSVSQAGGLSATEWRPDDPSNSAKLQRVASELQFTTHLARLPSTIVDHDVTRRASSFQSTHHGHATFIAIVQNGHANGVANEFVSERLRRAAHAGDAASPYDVEAAAGDEPHWLEGEIASPRTRLKTAIGRVVDRASLTRPVIAKLGLAALAGASLMLWFGAPGAPRSGQSGDSASADTAEIRSAPVVATAPFAKVASNEADATTPTDAPQQAAPDARPEKLQSRLSPSGPAATTATGADPSTAGEPRASAPETAVEAPAPGALVIEPPPIVLPTRSSSDLATSAVSEPRASAAEQPLNAPTTIAPVSKPRGKVASTAASADVATPESSEAQTVFRPAQIEKSPTKPALQKPTHEEAAAWQSNQPSATAPLSKSVVTGTKASKPWQTASVAVVAEHFAPVLVTLKDKAAALQIFEDLQKRHAATLANKKAELRSFVGPDGQTWYHVAALPAVTEAEAREVCHSLGSEGEALDCTVAPY